LTKPILYLDLDETILWNGEPVHNAKAFFLWCAEHFEIRWLTRWIPSGKMDEYQAKTLWLRFERQIHWREFQKWDNPKSFWNFKNEAVDFDETRPWVWVENRLDAHEDFLLAKSGHYSKFYVTDLRDDEDPHGPENAVARTWKRLSEDFNIPIQEAS
jgi:hypothetical protein